MVTKNSNDVISLSANMIKYNHVKLHDFQLDGEQYWRASFKKGYSDQHVTSFKSCLYLSGHMLGYSKMLMQCSFQFLTEVGAILCMTDTDSAVFMATDAMYKQYAELFIPDEKTIGGMVLEADGVLIA